MHVQEMNGCSLPVFELDRILLALGVFISVADVDSLLLDFDAALLRSVWRASNASAGNERTH